VLRLTSRARDAVWAAQFTDSLITLNIINQVLILTCTVGLLSGIVEWDGLSLHHPHIPRPRNPI
jgi:hypothetical protein